MLPDIAFLNQIEAIREQLTSSEGKVAEFVLSNPNMVTKMSISALAKQVQVSEPTVARFCKAIGFSGLKEFKIQLARTLGGVQAPASLAISQEDTAGSAATKVLDRSIRALINLRDTLDSSLLDHVARTITTAGRLEFYGQGNSGIVALDGQHRFFRLGIPTVAYSDPHIHAMSAALLGEGDVVIAISASGRTLDILRSIEIAKRAGAYVVGITTRSSPLMRLCNSTIAVDSEQDDDLLSPMISRLLHLEVLDMLATLVAIKMGPSLVTTVRRVRQTVAHKRTDV